jgi:class 3 adenylate cyclase
MIHWERFAVSTALWSGRGNKACLLPERVSTWGTLVFRDGDYFGKTVNVAARIADYARPGEVLISDSAAQHLPAESTVTLRTVGPIALKGVSDPLTLHTVTSVREQVRNPR